MPIYAYKCSSCQMSKDILRKISDAPLTLCPACGSDALTKQVTAAGFQLKGSGWYVTDFKDGTVKEQNKDPQGTADKPPSSADSAVKPAADTCTPPSPSPSSPAPPVSTSTALATKASIPSTSATPGVSP